MEVETHQQKHYSQQTAPPSLTKTTQTVQNDKKKEGVVCIGVKRLKSKEQKEVIRNKKGES